ncbi:hypothetical protein C7212DRAFT_341906 [Tuber magnatum]|uniref:Uncharacterized protein n=1 Tax=Tuber magnatum TaxID=42249 RepID=A0A317T0I6_9PEZI|nr:hypothetical protein C7212DRAFT_341906 [Tuber magnatum]
MSQHYQPQPASTIQRKSSQSPAALPLLPPNTDTTSALSLDNVTVGSLLGVYSPRIAPTPTVPTRVESNDGAGAQNSPLQLNPPLVEPSKKTTELDTGALCADGEAAIFRDLGNFRTLIERTNQDNKEEEEEEEEVGGGGQKCADNDSDSVAFDYVCRLSAHVGSLPVNHSTSGHPHRKPNRRRRRQRLSPGGRGRVEVLADPGDLVSRIADWIPPPPELPLSSELLDPEIAAAYPLPYSRACSEPTPSTQQPPYQLPPYPAAPHSTVPPPSLLHGTSTRRLSRLRVSPSLASSATTDITWGPDSPLTSALRLKRAVAVSALPPLSPTHSMFSRDSNSTGVTDVEAELGALEEAGRREVLRQRVLLWRLIAERDGGGSEIERGRSD